VVVFNRFRPISLSKEAFARLKSNLKETILGIHISRAGGDVLYSFTIDKTIKIDLISQFVAALSVFGEEMIGGIKQFILKGVKIDVVIYFKHQIILSVFYHTASRIKEADYIDKEAEIILDDFYETFKEQIQNGRNNQLIYEKFDKSMLYIIHSYFKRIELMK
jgi:hypothetical protein